MDKWKSLGKKEELSPTGILRLLTTGHGSLKGMYRKPALLNGVPYYRYHNKKGSVCYRKVEDLVRENFPDSDIEINMFWYKLACGLILRHNINMKLRYAFSFRKNEKKKRRKSTHTKLLGSFENEELEDIFQNNKWAG